jgi:hypothetical protein
MFSKPTFIYRVGHLPAYTSQRPPNDVAESSASADPPSFRLPAFNFSSAPFFLASFHSFHYFIDLQIPATRHLHCSPGRLPGMAHS